MLEKGLYFILIDPEIKKSYCDKPGMFLSTYGPGALELIDETNSLKEKDVKISDFLHHSAKSLKNFDTD